MPRTDHTVAVDDVGDEYRDLNRANWDARVPLHAVSHEYGLDRYRSDPTHLSDVVTFDLPLLGDIAGLDVVHLQCHIGTDTLSLDRLGARVTGLDFSRPALEVARALAADCDSEIEYVEADVYDAVETLGADRFDLVYTGIGALCWLPSVMRWAEVVAGLLRPGGHLFIREGHPVLWALDDPRPDREVVLRYPYFEGPGVEFDEAVTYVAHDHEIEASRTIGFNHGLGEIITALQHVGMEFVSLTEHDSVPWAALGDQMEELPGGEYRLIDRPERLPHSYTLRARRR
jgi:SAM-dependent methyltransferase